MRGLWAVPCAISLFSAHDSAPIQNAAFWREGAPLLPRARRLGTYLFEAAPAGEVQIEAPGYLPARLAVTAPDGRAVLFAGEGYVPAPGWCVAQGQAPAGELLCAMGERVRLGPPGEAWAARLPPARPGERWLRLLPASRAAVLGGSLLLPGGVLAHILEKQFPDLYLVRGDWAGQPAWGRVAYPGLAGEGGICRVPVPRPLRGAELLAPAAVEI